jgi:glycerate 2-kinase
VLAIAHAAIAAVDPVALVQQALTPEIEGLIGGGPLRVVAAGKASGRMLAAFLSARPRHLESACVVGTERGGAWPSGVESHVGGHPVPTQSSIAAGTSALETASAVARDGTLVVLLSGGASSLMSVPASGLTLTDKQETTRRLLREGADIYALNAVRKHLSRIKGGRLAAATPGSVVALVVSDVVGDDLSVIGSGPTVGDPSTYQDALEVLDRFGGRSSYPPSAVSVLQQGADGGRDETPKPGERSLQRAVTRLIGGARHAMEGARLEAIRRGYEVHVCATPVVGEARNAAKVHAELLRSVSESSSRPRCVISSGETTVRVTGSGVGGRNQEFALALAEALHELGVRSAAISIGTDGIDGPTDAAGALVDSSTLDRSRALGMGDPMEYLKNNDAYRYFQALCDLVVTGPTGTNVGDVQVAIVAGNVAQSGRAIS